MRDDSTPTIFKRTTEYSTPWFEVIAKDVGTSPADTDKYYFVRPADYVLVLALTERGDILFVRQYRPSVEDYTLELPAGHVDPGEEPQLAAVREFEEETGRRAGQLELLGQLTPDNGRLCNRLWCYIATGVPVEPSAGWQPEAGVDVVLCPTSDVWTWIAERRLRHSHDLATIALAVSQRRWSEHV